MKAIEENTQVKYIGKKNDWTFKNDLSHDCFKTRILTKKQL